MLGAAVLWLTLSRVGLVAFLLMIAYLLVRANVWLKGHVQAWVVQRWQKEEGRARSRQRVVSLGITLCHAGGVCRFVLWCGVPPFKVDPRMADLFKFLFEEDNPLLAYADSLNFSSRSVYWEGGWSIFNDHPFFGVGLGNAGYFFPEKLSGYAMWLVEVRHLLFRSHDHAECEEPVGAVVDRNRHRWFFLLCSLVLPAVADRAGNGTGRTATGKNDCPGRSIPGDRVYHRRVQCRLVCHAISLVLGWAGNSSVLFTGCRGCFCAFERSIGWITQRKQYR